MAAVTLQALTKRFEDTEVIRGIDLQIADGEFMVFVGPSGCGKTTTLRMIAGLESPSQGNILIDGQRCNDIHPAERGAAMVFQSYALYPHMTVAENMGFALRMAGVGRAQREDQVRRAAQSLRLDHLLERYPKELSGGQRQRVAIGRAIVREPKVFLFDEPLSNLDAALRVDMRIELRRLHQTLRSTMIYVTHDQVEAMTLADRIAVFKDGRIEQVGSPLELYDKPINRFVAGFMGSPKINFVARPRPQSPGDHHALWALLSPHDDQRVASRGVRPDQLQVSAGDDGVPATLALVEHLGDSAIAHLRVDGIDDMLRARIEPGERMAVQGSRVRLCHSAATSMGFDTEGRRLE
jgi:multiple sugar transport system ATP-binding protein